jgi:hypothetical protein
MTIRLRTGTMSAAHEDVPQSRVAPVDPVARDEVVSLDLVRAQRRHQRTVEQLAANGPPDHLRAVTLQRGWERRRRPARLRTVQP